MRDKTLPPLTHCHLTENHLGNPDYKPANLLDFLCESFEWKNDAALSRALQLQPSIISKIRNKQAEVTPAILVRMHDVTKLSINELRELMGVKPPVLQ